MDSKNNLSNNEKLNRVKLKDILDNIKSVYFLEKIFDNMKKNKSLEIIKYNKKLQKRLNICINDYIKYSQLYSSIEIELKIADNIYGKFINISDNEKEYYHIYFNNSHEEVKRNYLKEKEKVNMIRIKIDYQVNSFQKLFYDCRCISSVDFKKFFRINITGMHGMFYYCSSIKEINLSNFNTDNVTDMSCMFFGCTSLKELNLSNFNTNKVTDMKGMFYNCSALEKLYVSNFNTNNVIDMSDMFSYCLALKELDISNFNMNNVNDMNCMFYQCSDGLKNIIKEQNNNINIDF